VSAESGHSSKLRENLQSNNQTVGAQTPSKNCFGWMQCQHGLQELLCECHCHSITFAVNFTRTPPEVAKGAPNPPTYAINMAFTLTLHCWRLIVGYPVTSSLYRMIEY